VSVTEREPPGESADVHALRAVLTTGDLEVRGRIMPASNATFLAEVATPAGPLACVYKPVRGERPLWDFPSGTLAQREVAAYTVSVALGWDVVPLTVLRGGPHGEGMVQVWQEPVEDADPVDLCPPGETPPGYRHVLDAEDGAGNDVSLVHEDSTALRRMAVFDVLVNNADRKGGHVLPMADGHRYGVDHGICFHTDYKLRTVLWGWADERLADDERDAVECLTTSLSPGSDLATVLGHLLTEEEVAALRGRCRGLLRAGRMPSPEGHWPAIPWPAF
jgi:uncharacterized repeat protein (TIGR03843 family)